jgi:hypothetical protein
MTEKINSPKKNFKRRTNNDYFSQNGLQKNIRPTQDASFQKLIEVAANHLGLGDQLYSIRICHEARKFLGTYFPGKTEGEAPPIKVVSCKSASLTISAANSSLLHQLTMKKHLLQTELNAKFGLNTIKKINLRSQS